MPTPKKKARLQVQIDAELRAELAKVESLLQVKTGALIEGLVRAAIAQRVERKISDRIINAYASGISQ